MAVLKAKFFTHVFFTWASKFIFRATQKSSIFPSKANYAKGLLALLLSLTPLKLEKLIAEQSPPQKEELTIDENLHDGKVLVLSDGSTWEVAPQDLATAQLWIIPAPLKIEKSNNPSYPYQIINIQTNSSILARPIVDYDLDS